MEKHIYHEPVNGLTLVMAAIVLVIFIAGIWHQTKQNKSQKTREWKQY